MLAHLKKLYNVEISHQLWVIFKKHLVNTGLVKNNTGVGRDAHSLGLLRLIESIYLSISDRCYTKLLLILDKLGTGVLK